MRNGRLAACAPFLLVLLLFLPIGCDDHEADGAVCELPAEAIACTEGDDTPCTAVCAASYCWAFGACGGTGSGATICTTNCNTVADCPEGWSCNMMGRCRYPF